MPKDYITYTHRRTEIETVGELISRNDIQFFNEQYTSTELLNYRPLGLNKTNRENIFDTYTKQEEKDNETVPDSQLLLKPGTKLYFPKNKVRAETLFVADTNTIAKQINVNAFLADKLNTLLRDPKYKRIDKLKVGGQNKTQFPHITVWMWIRALGEAGEGEWINVSPFITNCSTNIGSNGGSFDFSLTPIQAKYNELGGGWTINKSSISHYNLNALRGGYTAQSHLYKNYEGKQKRNNFFFNDVIQENDLVYIRYETLELEKEKRLRDSGKLKLNNSDIPGNTYDLIGLVDQNSISFNAQNNDVQIKITGRDLMKVAIEDGCYFFPLEFAQGVIANLGENERSQNKVIQRSFINGKLLSLNAYTNRTIQFSLKFVMQQLSNSGLVPNEVFSGYPKSELTRKFIKDNQETIRKQENLESKKDSAITYIKRVRRESGLSAPEKSLEDTASNGVFNSILSLERNDNLIGLDEEGNKIVTKQAINQLNGSLFDRNKIDITTYFQSNPGFRSLEYVRDYFDYKENIPEIESEQALADGVWQIIKLVIEGDNVENNAQTLSNRRIVDSSIAEEQGSIINYFKKICQEPFVEFRGDTYGDKYYFIVRTPPFDKKKFTGLVYSDIETEESEKGNDSTNIPFSSELEESQQNAKFSDTIIEIEDSDVLNESISYNDDEVYTFYQLTPKGLFFGNESQATLAFLPAVYLDRFSDIWGSKPYSVVSNYVTYNNIGDDNASKREKYLQAQVFYDLKYLIDCHSYLPFTKKGTITINGDRRIKKGTCIYHKARNEVYYVDGVQQSYSMANQNIDRTTTITVSRGMKEPYIRGKLETFTNSEGLFVNKFISYFNIVKTPIDESVFSQNLGGTNLSDRIFENWTVDKDVFDFFLKRRYNKE